MQAHLRMLTKSTDCQTLKNPARQENAGCKSGRMQARPDDRRMRSAIEKASIIKSSGSV